MLRCWKKILGIALCQAACSTQTPAPAPTSSSAGTIQGSYFPTQQTQGAAVTQSSAITPTNALGSGSSGLGGNSVTPAGNSSNAPSSNSSNLANPSFTAGEAVDITVTINSVNLSDINCLASGNSMPVTFNADLSYDTASQALTMAPQTIVFTAPTGTPSPNSLTLANVRLDSNASTPLTLTITAGWAGGTMMDGSTGSGVQSVTTSSLESQATGTFANFQGIGFAGSSGRAGAVGAAAPGGVSVTGAIASGTVTGAKVTAQTAVSAWHDTSQGATSGWQSTSSFFSGAFGLLDASGTTTTTTSTTTGSNGNSSCVLTVSAGYSVAAHSANSGN